MSEHSHVRVLITAGPTIEEIDPVRYISNYSSGKQGYQIAKQFVEMGAKVTLVSGPVNLEPPEGLHEFVAVKSAKQMLAACKYHLPQDIVICVAAVCDWRPKVREEMKIKKEEATDSISIELVKNPDILKEISNAERRPPVLVGFAAETNNIRKHAGQKLIDKNCDFILANNVSKGAIFGQDKTSIYFIAKDYDENWINITKEKAAEKLAGRLIKFLNEK